MSHVSPEVMARLKAQGVKLGEPTKLQAMVRARIDQEMEALSKPKTYGEMIGNPAGLKVSYGGRKFGHKFHAKRVEYDGHSFPSEAEGAYYLDLKKRQASGEVLFFLLQTPFHLPGKTKYLLDFMVFKADGSCDLVDVKGMVTAEFKLKRRQVEELYPVKITLVRYHKCKTKPSYFEAFEP